MYAVFVIPVLKLSGAERVVIELARRLPAHGIATSIISLEDDRTPLGEQLRGEGLVVSGLRLSRRRSLACATALLARLPQERPLTINAHLFHANFAARLAAARMPPDDRAQVRVVTTIQVVERRFRPWQFWLDRWTAAYGDAEVCISRAVERFQRARTGLPKNYFRLIESGIDLQRFTPSAPRPFGAHVVSVGRLDVQKNYPLLLRAWQRVEAALPAARLTIAGDGPEAARLRRLAAKLGLRNVSLPGFVADVPALMQSADVYAQPSAWEGFGLTVAEAMACALPVIVTDVDSLPELVTHECTGLVLPSVAERWSDALLSLLRDEPRARALGQAAAIEARTRFDAARMAAAYAALFRALHNAPPTTLE